MASFKPDNLWLVLQARILLPRAHSPNDNLAIDGVWKAAQIYTLAAIRNLEGS
jgi:hypothetical protein